MVGEESPIQGEEKAEIERSNFVFLKPAVKLIQVFDLPKPVHLP